MVKHSNQRAFISHYLREWLEMIICSIYLCNSPLSAFVWIGLDWFLSFSLHKVGVYLCVSSYICMTMMLQCQSIFNFMTIFLSSLIVDLFCFCFFLSATLIVHLLQLTWHLHSEWSFVFIFHKIWDYVWSILDVSNDQFGCFFQLNSSVDGHKVKEEYYSFDVHVDKEHWSDNESRSMTSIFLFILEHYCMCFLGRPLCLLWMLLVVAKIYLRPCEYVICLI